jgi:zinc transporter 5/7
MASEKAGWTFSIDDHLPFMECSLDAVETMKLNRQSSSKPSIGITPTAWVILILKLQSMTVPYLPYPTQSLISLPILVCLSWKSLGSGLTFFLHLISLFLLCWAISSPHFSFPDRCFLVCLARELQISLGKSRIRPIALFLALVLFLLSADFTLKKSALSLFLCLGSVCVTFGKRSLGHSLEIGFDFPSLVLLLVVEILSARPVRQSSIAIFAALCVRPRIDAWPKPVWTSEAKRLILFFFLNFAFMFVEFWVGLATNSLGLLSDAFHMLCDNISLCYSAATALFSHQPPTAQFSFGFARLEIVTSFTNGILLLYISVNLLAEAISRLITPEEIREDNLLLVSVLGLFVNLLGLCFTNDSSGNSVFLRSIFLHVLVDSLGSVAVILSSICVVKFGILICDPICSLLIAVSVFGAAIPLLRDVLRSLMLTAPSDIGKGEVGVFGRIEKFNAWTLRERVSVIAVRIRHGGVGEEDCALLQMVTRYFQEKGVHDTTIEICA